MYGVASNIFHELWVACLSCMHVSDTELHIWFIYSLEASLKEEVEKSLQMKPKYETLVARAKLALVCNYLLAKKPSQNFV